jgi:hypothetical protein
MGALIMGILLLALSILIVTQIQKHARWHREEPADNEWIAQLKRWNRHGFK